MYSLAIVTPFVYNPFVIMWWIDAMTHIETYWANFCRCRTFENFFSNTFWVVEFWYPSWTKARRIEKIRFSYLGLNLKIMIEEFYPILSVQVLGPVFCSIISTSSFLLIFPSLRVKFKHYLVFHLDINKKLSLGSLLRLQG